MRLPLHALLLCVAGSLLGIAGNHLSPRPARLGEPVKASADAPGASCEMPGGVFSAIRRVSVEEATPLCLACSALFVDARSAREFSAGHVDGALHLAPGEAVDPVLWRLGVYSTVIVYDGEPSCSQAEAVARTLVERGVRDVRVLAGAWPAWMAAGGPGTSGPCAACGEREERFERLGGSRRP